MSLASIAYITLVAGVVLALWLVRHVMAQKFILIAASLAFYWTWSPKATILLAGLATVTWALGSALSMEERLLRRKLLVAAQVTLAIGMLVLFKYSGFLATTLRLTGGAGQRGSLPIAIFAAAGISFFTLQTISYVVDVYRRDERARGLLDVMLLVSLFPHLIAGPLLRSRTFLAQFDQPLVITGAGVTVGFGRYLMGVVQKMLIADRLGMFVDTVWARPSAWTTATVWLAVLAYSLQILFDFVGYSSMAIGSAQCMGLSLPENFRSPYASLDITDFWRRWHISLSSWLRDYLYIPLGGNRLGPIRRDVNLVVVMALGGLWHGAAWHFAIWGVAHGVALVSHKAYAATASRRAWRWRETQAYKAAAWLLTFLFVSLAWVLFRADSMADAVAVYTQLLGATGSAPAMTWMPTSLFVILGVIGAYSLARALGRDVARVPVLSFRGALVLGLVLGALVFLSPVQSTPFVYAGF